MYSYQQPSSNRGHYEIKKTSKCKIDLHTVPKTVFESCFWTLALEIIIRVCSEWLLSQTKSMERRDLKRAKNVRRSLVNFAIFTDANFAGTGV
jgi:hypothetical protein